ncbi:LOW QUALITY PROTEIN: nodal modulator 1-like [Homalodisca vitripennis]|uniref:LOW QUALITY PROTEIN: nodal modulator 1-like n=1 Tax=Homalodisca vitripennis TaxID=197043 RepID=UPI001EEA25D3|nr:LOW QUALITY PROTEIN: nodal modulator 1-like [Homalodisca vitripennis]
MIIRIYKIFNIISLILCIYQHYCSANDVLGCNGFVKSTVGEIDFSKVEVKMFTKQGSLKDQTECAPNNGYYFLPLYDKGEYILKVAPPLGWNFEPAEVTINVDGETDSCSLGIDINFVLQGFAVASFGDSIGPKGVVVNLLSTSAKPEVLLSTTTQVGGGFLLTPVKPGQYNIEISHERWHLAKKRTPVTVKNGNTEVAANSLVVSGYDVSGSVTSDSEPIMGVSFLLHYFQRFPTVGCDSSALTGFSPTGLDLKELIPICHVASDARGRFIFPSLPSGTYTVVPHYKGMHSIKFDVQPQHLAFKVEHDSLELPMVFQVKGFSVEGRVLWSPGGKPLEGGTTVMLNEKLVSKTGADGTFYLDSMTPGIYKLLIQAKDVEFKEQNVKVTPNTPHIGDLVPTTYRVCGRVTVSQPGFSPASRQVDLIHSTSEDYYGTISDATGGFCVFVRPGEYTISLHVTDAEHEDGLQFAPLKRKVKVVDSPVSGIDFSQLQATVKGSIKCLTSPCPEILVTLQALSNLWVNELVSVLSKDKKRIYNNNLEKVHKNFLVPSQGLALTGVNTIPFGPSGQSPSCKEL